MFIKSCRFSNQHNLCWNTFVELVLKCIMVYTPAYKVLCKHVTWLQISRKRRIKPINRVAYVHKHKKTFTQNGATLINAENVGLAVNLSLQVYLICSIVCLSAISNTIDNSNKCSGSVRVGGARGIAGFSAPSGPSPSFLSPTLPFPSSPSL